MNAFVPAETPVLVELAEGQPTTTSLDVAAHFGKRHDTVLQAICQLDCPPDFVRRNFAACVCPGENNKLEPFSRLTRDGFTFLCMGFTGKEAARWTEAYIDAFNRMEEDLRRGFTRAVAASPRGPFAKLIGKTLQPGPPWLALLDLQGNERYIPHPSNKVPLRGLIEQRRQDYSYGTNRELTVLAAACTERLSEHLEDACPEDGSYVTEKGADLRPSLLGAGVVRQYWATHTV